MAHVKSGGRANQGTPRKGRRLGVKKYGDEAVKPGTILVRQRGSQVHSGLGTGMGRDFTIFAKLAGTINFFQKQGKKFVEILTK